MSDELIKSLNGRLADLEKDRDKAVAFKLRAREKAEALEREKAALQARLDDLSAKADKEFSASDAKLKELADELAGWKTRAEAAPEEKDARIKELETTLRTRDYRDAFVAKVTDLGAGFTVEDIWHHAGFDPASVEALDDGQIAELIGKAKDARPGLFASTEATGKVAERPNVGQAPPKPPLRVDGAASRGARDSASSQVTYRKSDLHAADWMVKKPGLVEALRTNNAVCED